MTDINQIKTLTSNVLEQNIDDHIIVLFDDELRNVWYLKCRSAINSQTNLIRKQLIGEILIHKNKNNNQLFWNDTYVDTTHLYKIKEEDFDYIINKYSNKFIVAESLDNNNIDKIYQNLISNLNNKPPYIKPYINIIDVNVDKNNDHISFYTEYANQTTIDSEINLFKFRNKNDKDYQNKLQYIISLKDDIINRSVDFKSELEGISGFINNYYSEILKERMMTDKSFTL